MLDLNILGWTLLLSLSINLIFFVIAFIIKTDKFTDITYSLTFIVINFFSLMMNLNNISIVQILVIILLMIWSIRLGTYLLVRIFKIKKDKRFNQMRSSFMKFLFFWLIQALTVYIVSIPTIVFVSIIITFNNINPQFLMFLLLIPIFFLIYETIADIQKYNYYKIKPTPFLKSGLYKLSRFPNYFAEICFWTSLCIIELITLFFSKEFNYNYLFLLFNMTSPLFLALTIIFVSGVKLLDISNIQKYKDNNEYLNYVKTTSAMVPFFGKKGFSMLATKENINKI